MRADIEHEVSHDAKNSHFYHVFSTYEDGRGQARANQGVWPYGYHSQSWVVKMTLCFPHEYPLQPMIINLLLLVKPLFLLVNIRFTSHL